MTKPTRTEADDLFEFLDEGDTETFELAPAANGKPAKTLSLRGATATEYVKFVVRRIPEVEALYVDQIRDGAAQAKAAADEKAAAAAEPEDVPFGTRRPAKAEPAPAAPVAAPASTVEDEDPVAAIMVATAKASIAAGAIEEKAALLAVCAGYPGNVEFERRIIGHSRFQEAAARASFKTRGADPFGFSAEVAEVILNQAGLPKELPEDLPEATAA